MQTGAFNQPAHHHHGAGSNGGAAVGDHAGIGRGHGNVVVVDADGLGGDLREHGVCALAEFGVRHQHAHFAVGSYIHAGKRIQDALAGARKAGAVIESSDADAALDRAGGIFAGEPRSAIVIVAFSKGALEQLIHDDRLAHQLFCRSRVAGVEKVFSPEFKGIDAEAAAISSMWRSRAKMAWGAPKPRNAP